MGVYKEFPREIAGGIAAGVGSGAAEGGLACRAQGPVEWRHAHDRRQPRLPGNRRRTLRRLRGRYRREALGGARRLGRDRRADHVQHRRRAVRLGDGRLGRRLRPLRRRCRGVESRAQHRRQAAHLQARRHRHAAAARADAAARPCLHRPAHRLDADPRRGRAALRSQLHGVSRRRRRRRRRDPGSAPHQPRDQGRLQGHRSRRRPARPWHAGLRAAARERRRRDPGLLAEARRGRKGPDPLAGTRRGRGHRRASARPAPSRTPRSSARPVRSGPRRADSPRTARSGSASRAAARATARRS